MSLKSLFAGNLSNLMSKFNVDRYKMSDDLNVPYSTIGSWLNETYFPRAEILEEVANYFGVSVPYLLTDPKNKRPQAVRIKVYGTIPAGIPLEAIQDITDCEEIPVEWTLGDKEYIALKVKGDSMFPTYLDGDVVIVLLQSDFENGQDCVVIINGFDATLKRCYKTEKGIQLKPLNTVYPPKTYGENDDSITILGIVKEIRRKV